MAKVAAAITGSTLGLLSGLYAASFAGFHEHEHVFTPAIVVGMTIGSLSIFAASSYIPLLSVKHRIIVATMVRAAAIFSVILFFSIVA